MDNFDISGIISLTDRYSAELAKFSRGINSMSEQTQKATESMTSSFAGVGTAIAALGIGYALKEGITAAFGIAASMESTRTSFNVLIGDVELAGEKFKNLKALADSTPFTFGDLSKAGQTLLAYGDNVGTLEDTVSRLGDLSSGNAEKLGRLSLAYGQVVSKGKLQGQELAQFNEAGVGLTQVIAQMYGKTNEEVLKLSESGAIGADIVLAAIKKLTDEGGPFYEMNKKQSETLNGRWSTMKDTISNTVLAIVGMKDGEVILGGMADKAKGVITSISAIAQKIQVWVENNRELVSTIAMVVTGALGIIAVIGTVSLVVSGLSMAFGVLSGAAVAAWTAVMGPIGLIVGAIALVGFAIYELWENWDEAIGWLGDRWTELTGWLGTQWDDAMKWIGGALDTAMDYITDTWNSAVSWMMENIPGLSTAVSAVSETISYVWTGLTDSISSMWGGAVGYMRENFPDVVTMVESGAEKMMSAFRSVSDMAGGVWQQIKAYIADIGGSTVAVKNINTGGGAGPQLPDINRGFFEDIQKNQAFPTSSVSAFIAEVNKGNYAVKDVANSISTLPAFGGGSKDNTAKEEQKRIQKETEKSLDDMNKKYEDHRKKVTTVMDDIAKQAKKYQVYKKEAISALSDVGNEMRKLGKDVEAINKKFTDSLGDLSTAFSLDTQTTQSDLEKTLANRYIDIENTLKDTSLSILDIEKLVQEKSDISSRVPQGIIDTTRAYSNMSDTQKAVYDAEEKQKSASRKRNEDEAKIEKSRMDELTTQAQKRLELMEKVKIFEAQKSGIASDIKVSIGADGVYEAMIKNAQGMYEKIQSYENVQTAMKIRDSEVEMESEMKRLIKKYDFEATLRDKFMAETRRQYAEMGASTSSGYAEKLSAVSNNSVAAQRTNTGAVVMNINGITINKNMTEDEVLDKLNRVASRLRVRSQYNLA